MKIYPKIFQTVLIGAIAFGIFSIAGISTAQEVIRIPDDVPGPPYVLDQAGKTYILTQDISAPGTAITITASGITLDLNGHTITYDDFPNTGLPNPGFENGSGDVPSDWDLSQAPSAKRRPNYEKPMVEKWHLLFEASVASGEEIVSPWTYLPASAPAKAYLINAIADWEYGTGNVPLRGIAIEFEDGSIVYSAEFTDKQEFNFTTKPTVGRYRIHYKVVNSTGKAIRIDQMDLRPGGTDIPATGNYGVLVNYGIRASIKNGKIIQGQAKGPTNHNIHIYSGNIEVSDMYLEAGGMEAANIWADYVGGKVVNSTLVSGSLYRLGSRHQIRAPLMFLNGFSGVVISNNNITSGPGWGCIYMTSANGTISNNYCFTKTTITNHHAIAFRGNQAKVFNNTIVADPGQGIAVGEDQVETEVEIFNNTIYLKSQAPNFEYGRLQLEAITLKDWKGRMLRNSKVHDNKIFLTGDFDNYYGPGPQVVLGILNAASGGVEFYNNYIKVDVIDSNSSIGAGVALGGEYLDENTIWRNNVIESNHKNVLFGGTGSYAANVRNTTFVSNTLIKGANPLPDYSAFSVGSPSEIANTHLIDTKLVNGATMDVGNLYEAKYNYFVDWYLNVMVKNNSDTPIEGATVEVKDVNGTVVFSGATDANGGVNNITLNQYRKYGERWGNQPKGIEYHTPHTLTISKPGYETYTQTLTMDASKSLTVTLVPIFVDTPPFASDLSRVKAYPNPYKGDKHSQVVFDNLTANIKIRIYTLKGELVREIKEQDGDRAYWDVRNKNGEKVSSGIYIYCITNSKGEDKKGKVGIIK